MNLLAGAGKFMGYLREVVTLKVSGKVGGGNLAMSRNCPELGMDRETASLHVGTR